MLCAPLTSLHASERLHDDSRTGCQQSFTACCAVTRHASDPRLIAPPHTMFFSSYLRHSSAAISAAIIASTCATPRASACSICGCSLSSDWALQNFNSSAGTEIDGRFEYFAQDQLRSGTHAVDRGTLTFPNDDEVQQKTLNRGYWLTIDQAIGANWGITAQLPSYSRFHTTIAEGDTDISSSRASGIGDARILGRYQQQTLHQGWSFQFGLKLPTGKTDQTFFAGPQAGELLDRGLQLGTGSTDAIVGASYFLRFANAWSAFAQTVVEVPFTAKDDYRPAASFNTNVGIRWLNTSRCTPQLQINARWDTREHGANADFDNSGDTIVDISPGLTVDVTQTSNLFVFLQLPLYQRVNGLQIEPHWLLSTGFRWRL